MKTNEVLEAIADIGWQGTEPNHGRDCLAYTPNEDSAHLKFVGFAEELRAEAERAGMRVDIETDPYGNTHVTLVGNSDRIIMMCSHLDSVRRGGRYDGIVGVAGGLDVLRRFVATGEKPEKSIQVVAFRGEESTVTGKSMIGSSLAIGALKSDYLRTLHHSENGKNMLEVLAERGLDRDRVEELERNPFIDREKLDAVLEMHIEQSGVLEAACVPVGVVVHGIGGSRRGIVSVGEKNDMENFCAKSILRIIIKGSADHSGGTPMNGERFGGAVFRMRRDALHAMSRFLPYVRDKHVIGIATPGGSFNTIPGQCVVDIAIDNDAEVDSINKILREKVDGNRFILETSVISAEEYDVLVIRESTVDAAMSIVSECEVIGRDMAKETGGLVRATVGNVLQTEGSLNLFFDERRLNNDAGAEMAMRMDQSLVDLGKYYPDVPITMDEVRLTSATPFPDSGIQDIMRRVHHRLFSVNAVEMGSMPGHDCANVIRGRIGDKAVPGGMIFIRSLMGGLSHNPQEKSSPEDIERGTEFLFEVVRELCHQAKGNPVG